VNNKERNFRVYSDKDITNDHGIPDELVGLVADIAEQMQPFLTDNIDGQIALRICLGFLKQHMEAQFHPDSVAERADMIRVTKQRKGLGDHAEDQVQHYLEQQEGTQFASHQVVAAMNVIVENCEWLPTMQMAERSAEICLEKGDLPSNWQDDLKDLFPENSKLASALAEMLINKGLGK